jgi:5-methyltetrahydrofolate--homocysteine methyltransferase
MTGVAEASRCGYFFIRGLKREVTMEDLDRLFDAVVNGDAASAKNLTAKALESGIDPQELITAHLIPAMDEVGRRFECNEYYVPELLISARAMKSCLELINPILASRGSKPVGTVAIGTVKGDLHDIGKNLVASMLEGAGFRIIDLGVDVTPEKFVDEVRDKNPNILALSALLTTTMPFMKHTIDALKESGLREKVFVLIGGAPVTQRYADEIGADGYSDNASGAVALTRKLLRIT